MRVHIGGWTALSLWVVVVTCSLLCPVVGFAQAVSRYTLEDVAFLAGCWEGTLADGTSIRETYTPPRGRLMLGNSQLVLAGESRFFEFIQLAQTADGVVYRPWPNGRSVAAFRLVRASGTKAVFENAANDFPQRISYAYDNASGVFLARIERLDGSQAESFPMKACGGEIYSRTNT